MIRIPFSAGLAATVALSAVAAALPAQAQTEVVQPAYPDADRLAEEMRVLAADPRNVSALLDAGLLSVKLNDTSAALAFFARAEAIDPSNPRIAAGRGAALVRLERPGEALRLFQSAAARGLPAREYAADRGFAYDLLGQPGLAQQDYKLALQGKRDDEIVRRYALSLGITGDSEEAMRQLDPLLRRSDRAAWRARAFILAMNGDIPGAERIAASMMPGNMGMSLSPFFRRLGGLTPADRAFAVHFGELSPTQARLADSRLAPVLPAYVPASRPVQVAAVAAPAAQPSARDRRSRRDRERAARVAAPATGSRQPLPQAAAAAMPAPPAFVERAPPTPMVQPLPRPTGDQIEGGTAPTPTPTPAPVQLASRSTPPPERSTIVPLRAAEAAPTAAERPAPVSSEPARLAATQPNPTASTVVPASASLPTPAVAAPQQPAPEPRPEPSPVDTQPAAPAPVRAEPTPPGPAKVGQEDSVLAAIVSNITIPAEELEAVTAPPVDPTPAPAPAPEPVKPKPALAKREEPVAKPKAEVAAPAAKPVPVKGKPVPKADEPKPVKADPKAEKKPDPKAAKKPDPKAKDPAKSDPARIWVQVAGGANEETLDKAWKAVVAKAPAALKGRAAWWTPLRATNRVLTGPFKSAAEAQAFVNTLAKAGVSGFVFNSEAGQKVTKLAP